MKELREALSKIQEAIELIHNISVHGVVTKDEPMKVEKIAVKVNNEREFKLLMEHYAGLGWLNCEGKIDDTEFFHKEKVLEVTFHDEYSYLCEGSVYPSHTDLGYTVVDFDFWAAQNGVDVPKFVMKSEDGVDLYKGDKLFEVNKRWNSDEWYLVDADNGVGHWTVKCNSIKWLLGEQDGYVSKAFHSKEAALVWIEEQNKTSDVETTSNEVLTALTAIKQNREISWMSRANKEGGYTIIVEIGNQPTHINHKP